MVLNSGFKWKQLAITSFMLMGVIQPGCSLVLGQHASVLRFDAASVRLAESDHWGFSGGPGTSAPTLFQYRSATLRDLIRMAWDLDVSQIRSSVSIDTKHYDVIARLPDNTGRDQFREMLKALLAERFGLKMHIETQNIPAYRLTLVKSGSKLLPSKEGTPPELTVTVGFKDGYEVNRAIVKSQPLADSVSRLLARRDRLPVVNQTGLDGRYDYELTFAREGTDSDLPIPEPYLFASLREQLGVAVQKDRLPLPVIVIDAVNAMPTPD